MALCVGPIACWMGIPAGWWAALPRSRSSGPVGEPPGLLQVPVGPIGEVDPTLIGVDAAAQELLPGGSRPAYVPRGIDEPLCEALKAGVRGDGPWLVVVIGPAKVGKSRAAVSQRS